MPGQQLELITPVKPLLERFGHAFFQGAPHKPGVYIMSGAGDQVLYVGQSGNLRARLLQYKNVRRGSAPRKVLQLAHAVRSISWEVCATRTDAVIRENQLLRIHQPRFNRMNVYPQAYGFILCYAGARGFHLHWAHEPGEPLETFGAFKSLRTAFLPLLRTVWRILHQPKSLYEFPSRLLVDPGSRQFYFETTEAPDPILGEVRQLLAGDSDALLSQTQPGGTPFERQLESSDQECLRLFFQNTTRRTALLKQLIGESSTLVIPKEELDDLLALNKPKQTALSSVVVDV